MTRFIPSHGKIPVALFTLKFLCIGTLLLGGCNTLGSIENRSEAVNTTTAEYASSAVLLNVLRASEAEPLNFVSVTAVTGHDTFSASVGLPTIAVGPNQTAAQRLFLYGPNSIGGSESNDFNLSVVDDPQTYAALLRPVDPSTLGFFIDQDYQQSLLFFLFVSRMRVYDSSGTHLIVDSRDIPVDRYGDLINSSGTGINPDYRKNFYEPLDEYLNEGLSVRVDPTYVPQPGKVGSAKFCFDRRWFDKNNAKIVDLNHHRTDCSEILRPVSVKVVAARILQ